MVLGVLRAGTVLWNAFRAATGAAAVYAFDDIVHDGKGLSKIKETGQKVVDQGVSQTLADLKQDYTNLKTGVQDTKAKVGQAVDLAQRAASGEKEALSTIAGGAAEKFKGAAKAAKDAVMETPDADHVNPWRWLLGGTAAAGGSWWLLGKVKDMLFGEDKKEEPKKEGSNWFMRLAVVGALVGAAVFALRHFTSKNDFEQAARPPEPNAPSAAVPTTRTSFVHGAPLAPEAGATNVAFAVAAPAVPTTLVAREFAQANGVMDQVRANANNPEMQARAAIQRAQVSSAGATGTEAPEAERLDLDRI